MRTHKSIFSGTEVDQALARAARSILSINGMTPNAEGDISIAEVNTEIVTVLPETGEAGIDYILKSSGGCLLYKWIDGAWCTISGSLPFIGTSLPNVSEANELTDYYIKNEGTNYYTHYRFIAGKFETISSGGGGGGGGGSNTGSNLVVSRITTSPVIATPTDKVEIAVNFSCTDSDGETIDATYAWKSGNKVIDSGIMVQGVNKFDFTDHVFVGTQRFTLTVTDDTGNQDVKTWTVQIVDIRLESDFSDKIIYSANEPVAFRFTPYGSGVEKTVHFILDGEELESITTTQSGTSQSYELPAKPHGAHLLECYITATVNNTEIETDHIFKDIIYFDETSNVPVIGCVYRNDYFGKVSVRQYDTLVLPWVVYVDAEGKLTANAVITIDGVSTNKEIVGNTDNITYRCPDSGIKNITISCGATTVNIVLDVEKLDIDVTPVTANLAFDFNPTGLSNSSVNRLWADSKNPSICMTVSDNFDWSNGGYQLDADGVQYFCVKSGTTATITHNLFERDPKLYGSEFKVIFKTTNVKNVKATFLKCISDDIPVGLEMNVHEAYVKSSIDNLYIPYSEEDVIEMEYSIDTLDTSDPNATSLVLSYEDGTPFRPMVYDSTHRLHQYNPVPIVIGSPDCDVHIYRMKAYNATLSPDDVLANFIADGRDAQTMIARNDRNQIYDENNMITPESVAIACPNLKIIKIDCPRFTQDKSEFITNTSIECIHKNGDIALDNWYAVNCAHSGQGTTSNEYGYAGRNIDILMCFDGNYKNKKIPYDPNYITEITFGDGTTVSDGTGKVCINNNSIPNNYFNIKVNIASSENANNAILANRFNRFLPYVSKAQQNDSRVKNTMEFVNAVIFVRENDPDISTHREFNDCEWHFYAIGNIGDSKKTDNTRVNDHTDPKEFVVEIADNTLPNSRFDTGVTDSGGNMVYPISPSQWNTSNPKYLSLHNTWSKDDNGTYEFRYECDGISDDQQAANIAVWNEMYKWVITSTDEQFVREFDHWFIKESALYFYLFTERYTMIDNRAKNTFWHYSKVYDVPQFDGDDGYRFDFWDYDNDTSLGINNSGELTMTYGKEDIDYRTDGVPASGYIFNAADSVFYRRIRKLMHNDLCEMYVNRESANAWNSTGLTTEFDNWQSQFPEVLWKLDYMRKYYRTYKGISWDNSIAREANSRFLKFMMNGRKKYQRRQFDRDQDIYIGTKYVGTTVKADQIMFRCNTPVSAVIAPNYTLRIIPYSDMYLSVMFGNTDVIQIRAKAGQTYEVECPLDTMDNTAILIYAASRIQALNDISACYIEDNDFSKAVKLQKLIIGNSTNGYNNEFLSKLTLGNNPLLEILDVRNCNKLTGSINLSSCSNLTTLYATGTTITGVLFAPNGKVALAHLPNTVTSISMINLIYLSDLKLSYDRIESLTIENSNIDTLTVIGETVDTLNNLRLVGIDWTVNNTDILNQMLNVYTSYVSGKVTITGAVRQQELLKYANAWPDLIVDYKVENIVPQYIVTYVNADKNNTVLHQEYVDLNALPPDPYANGTIGEPMLESDEQYNYTFANWNDITTPVYSDRTVVAVYDTSIRTYNVRWFANAGEPPLYSVSVDYGKPATFAGNISPVGNDAHLYKVLTGWDKSTGFIRGDTDVYAVWDSKTIPAIGTELSDMSPAEIYAVFKSGRSSEFVEMADYVDITLGHDHDFTNVHSEVIAENEYFNGNRALTTEHRLFGSYETSFTIAIDLRFMDGNANATLLSCFENNNNNGFRIRLNNNALNVQWGSETFSVSYKGYRDIIVLRHRKGEKQLYVYTSTPYLATSPSLSKYFNLDSAYGDTKPRRKVLTTATDITTESKLTLGAVPYADGTHSFYGTGMVYWCKIWFDDIGNDVCEELASWHHETVRMEFCGTGMYQYSGTGTSSCASFVANNLLEDRGIKMLSATSDINWAPSVLRQFLRERVYQALPTVWKSLIKSVTIDASPNSTSADQTYSDDYLYVPSRAEVNGNIAFMESNAMRVKFNRFVVPRDGAHYNSSTDPQTDTDINVAIGDMWTTGGTTYILVDTETINRYKLTVKTDTSITTLGGWVAANKYWTRTPDPMYGTTYFSIVNTDGSISSNSYSVQDNRICLCFSI